MAKGEYQMKDRETEELRSKLLEEVYAMTFSGMPAAFIDESEIKHASAEKLIEIAKRYGMK